MTHRASYREKNWFRIEGCHINQGITVTYTVSQHNRPRIPNVPYLLCDIRRKSG